MTNTRTIIFDTLDELLDLASPGCSMWPEGYDFERSVNLQIRFKEKSRFSKYHIWLERALSAFEGRIRWGLLHVIPDERVYHEKLLLWPLMFVEQSNRYGPVSDDDLREFFGEENFKLINAEAMKDVDALAAHFRSYFHSHPPL